MLREELTKDYRNKGFKKRNQANKQTKTHQIKNFRLLFILSQF